MHQHGKDDSTGGSSESSAFSSNTFPLVSRSSMKRPFSLSSERECQQTSTVRDHFRCRGFRSRSKTLDNRFSSDTYAKSFQYRDLVGQYNAFVGCNNNNHHPSERSTARSLFDLGRSRRSIKHEQSGEHKKPHLFCTETILDEEMSVDDYEEDDDEDGNVPMFLDGKERLASSTQQSTGKQISTLSVLCRNKNNPDKSFPCSVNRQILDFNFNSTTALCSNTNRSKANFLLAQNAPFSASSQLNGQPESSKSLSESFKSKFSITHAAKSKVECDATRHTPRPTSTVTSSCELASGHYDESEEECSKLPDQFAFQKSHSSLAFPKSTSSCVDFIKTHSLTATNHIPTEAEKQKFQRSLDSATTLVFHRRSGLPLTSSPAPIRKSGTCFDFDSSLTSVNAIKKALFEKDSGSRNGSTYRLRSRISFSAPTTTSALLGNFEESVLNGRLDPASIVNGFTAEIGASGTFCPKHKTLPVTVFFYALQDSDKGEKISSPYLGHINLGPKGYHVPRQGTVQVTLFNPNGTVVKMFVVRYNLSDMPPNSRTFLRQRTLFMPSDANEHHPDNRKWLRYLIHLRFQSSKSGRIRLHTDFRILVFRKHDLDVATLNGGVPYELRSFVQMPSNPKYSKNIKS